MHSIECAILASSAANGVQLRERNRSRLATDKTRRDKTYAVDYIRQQVIAAVDGWNER